MTRLTRMGLSQNELTVLPHCCLRRWRRLAMKLKHHRHSSCASVTLLLQPALSLPRAEEGDTLEQLAAKSCSRAAGFSRGSGWAGRLPVTLPV